VNTVICAVLTWDNRPDVSSQKLIRTFLVGDPFITIEFQAYSQHGGKRPSNFVRSDRPSVLSRWKTSLLTKWGFTKVYISVFYFRKFVKKIQVWLKSDNNKEHFTWTTVYICDNIWLNSPKGKKLFRHNS